MTETDTPGTGAAAEKEAGKAARKASEGKTGTDTEDVGAEKTAVTEKAVDTLQGSRDEGTDGSSPRLTTAALGMILLAEGYSSLSVEILGLRRLMPYAGSTVLVTSIVLAAYLAALAIGYERGGKLAATGKNLRLMLSRRLGAAALLSVLCCPTWGLFWLSPCRKASPLTWEEGRFLNFYRLPSTLLQGSLP